MVGKWKRDRENLIREYDSKSRSDRHLMGSDREAQEDMIKAMKRDAESTKEPKEGDERWSIVERRSASGAAIASLWVLVDKFIDEPDEQESDDPGGFFSRKFWMGS